MNRIYFDNSATTPLCAEAKEGMCRAMDIFGNPSSLHSMGVEAENLVSKARAQILSALGVKQLSKISERSLVFTASGTEADNLALIGVATAKNFPSGKKIIISNSEHPAVLEPAAALEKRGFNVIRIPTVGGVPDYALLESVADKDTVLASFMLVNNETGAVYDIKRIAQIVKSKNINALIHTDCVQGFMNIPFSPKSLGADLISISAHKIGGPKGVGALYVSPEILVKKQLSPIVFGGGQESGLRSGTENVLGIVGFGEAVAAGGRDIESNIQRKTSVRSYLIDRLSDGKIPGIKLNIPRSSAPHIISITLPNIKSETMLHRLSQEGIFVSSGSACSSNTGSKSQTLKAFGLSEKEIDCTIRVSLSSSNTIEEAEQFLLSLENAVNTLAKIK